MTHDLQVFSSDRTAIHFETTGRGVPLLVFVHGWLGNVRWWDAQRDHFAASHQVVAIDLAGHGRSGVSRTDWSIARYADDIRAVLDHLHADQVVLVGHSMSGPNVLVAAAGRTDVLGVVLVDTMKNLDRLMPVEQVEQMLELYRTDYRRAVEDVLPNYLYSPFTPGAVRERLRREFLAAPAGLPVRAIEPLYKGDLRAIAAQVKIPVRAINSDLEPVDPSSNGKHFCDYDAVTISHVGHYPMLEKPAEFNRALEQCLGTMRAR
jgi:pimeloyl-ACP methyl ester carboxylesterase